MSRRAPKRVTGDGRLKVPTSKENGKYSRTAGKMRSLAAVHGRRIAECGATAHRRRATAQSIGGLFFEVPFPSLVRRCRRGFATLSAEGNCVSVKTDMEAFFAEDLKQKNTRKGRPLPDGRRGGATDRSAP